MKSFSILALASSAAAGPLAQLLPLIGGPHSPVLPAFPYPAIKAGCADYVDNVRLTQPGPVACSSHLNSVLTRTHPQFDVAYANTGVVPVAFAGVGNTTYNGTLSYGAFDYFPAYLGGYTAPTGPNVIGAPMLTSLLNNGSVPSLYPKPGLKQSAGFDLKSLKYACTQGAGLTALAIPAPCTVQFTGTKAAGGAQVVFAASYAPTFNVSVCPPSVKNMAFLQADFPAYFTGLSRVDVAVTAAPTGLFLTVPLIDNVQYHTCVSAS